MTVEGDQPGGRFRDDSSRLTVSVTIRPDGKLLFHDLTADLLPVLSRLCPNDRSVAERAAAAAAMKGEVER